MRRITRNLFAFVLFIYVSISMAKNLKNDHLNFYVSSVAIFGNRAFLALPRFSEFSSTLMEIPWSNWIDFHNFSKIAGKTPKTFKFQEWNNCKHLQNVISVDVEVNKARLWILDRGNEKCPAKIVVFNLFQNAFTHSCEFLIDHVDKQQLNFLIVDPIVVDPIFGVRAYVGSSKNDVLLIFQLNELKWWRLRLKCANVSTFVSTEFLTFHQKNNLLILSGSKENGIFSLDLNTIRQYEGPLAIAAKDTILDFDVTLVGEKLGPSSGLIADYKDGLIYFLTRDYAVVRWDLRNPSFAEFYDVLIQSYTALPYVSQLFADSRNGIWALVNPCKPSSLNSKCERDGMKNIQSAALKLLKFNRVVVDL